MNYRDFIISILLIFIILVLLILWYRNYVYNYCKNDMKCMKNKLIFNLNNLDNINNKLKNMSKSYENNDIQQEDENKIEGFIDINSWFSKSASANLPVSSGIPNEDLNTLEMKINNKPISNFNSPSKELNGNNDDFQDSNNKDILQSIGSKAIIKNNINNNINNENKFKNTDITILKDIPPQPTINSLFKKCQFSDKKCSEKSFSMGNFNFSNSIEGSGILTCGDSKNESKIAKAVAVIKNNSVYEIHIIDSGKGYDLQKPPKVIVKGGNGTGCITESIVDDNGTIKIIKVINKGYNYTETPNIIIDQPYSNSSCHLCCEM
jgi:hypothetical protein